MAFIIRPVVDTCSFPAETVDVLSIAYRSAVDNFSSSGVILPVSSTVFGRTREELAVSRVCEDWAGTGETGIVGVGVISKRIV
jgi:hypothetical protein